eukprot:m.67244 g.67244  ORF g.67244 m.67244 type:complete len:112 (+) comp11872_c0_seq2:159-494(+)
MIIFIRIRQCVFRPPPPLADNCSVIKVFGAGDNNTNGLYRKTPFGKNSTMYVKDETRAIYPFMNTWHLGQQNVQIFYLNKVNTTMPPSYGWSTIPYHGSPPSPLLQCVESP